MLENVDRFGGAFVVAVVGTVAVAARGSSDGGLVEEALVEGGSLVEGGGSGAGQSRFFELDSEAEGAVGFSGGGGDAVRGDGAGGDGQLGARGGGSGGGCGFEGTGLWSDCEEWGGGEGVGYWRGRDEDNKDGEDCEGGLSPP